MIFRNNLLGRLADADIAAVSKSMTEVTLHREELIAEDEKIVSHLYFPGSAVASVVTVMRNGQCVETSTIGRESAPAILPVLTGAPSLNRVFTQVAGSAIRVPAAVIRQQAERSPAMMLTLLKSAQMDAYQAELSVACNALHNVQARLARWLLLTRDRVGSNSIPLTQEFLAIMLGVQRTTVSKAASGLKKLNLIDYHRGQIVVLDRDSLIKVACECYVDDLRILKTVDG